MAKIEPDRNLEFLQNTFQRDFNQITDIRLLLILGVSYIDIVLDEIIKRKVKKYSSLKLNSFDSRISILDALGFFDMDEKEIEQTKELDTFLNIDSSLRYLRSDALNDIRVFQELRNVCAHSLILDMKNLDNDVKSKIGRFVKKGVNKKKFKDSFEISKAALLNVIIHLLPYSGILTNGDVTSGGLLLDIPK